MRILLAALAGAVIVFIASAMLHMATPLGAMGIDVLQNEDAVVEAFRANVPRSGLYLFPGLDPRAEHTEAETNAWTEKNRRGPYGLLVITHGGEQAMSPRQLGLEFLVTFVAAFIAAMLLARIRGSYLSRALVVPLLPLFALFSVTASHWIWYKFPAAFILGAFAAELIVWTLAGLAMAKIVRPAI